MTRRRRVAAALVGVGAAVAVVLVGVVLVGVGLTQRASPPQGSPSDVPVQPTRSSSPTYAPPSSTPPSSTPPSSGVPPTTVTPGDDRLDVTRYGAYGGTFDASRMTNFYNQVRFTCPTSAARADLAAGESVNITFASNANPDYVYRLNAGDAEAIAWMNEAIACVKTLTDLAATEANGTYVVGSFWHEGGCKKGPAKGYVPDDPVALGRAQQIALEAGKAASPNTVWQLWLCGYDLPWEKRQADQVVDPKPDIITVDPYAHDNSCDRTLTSTVTPDWTWVKTLASYAGYVGVSETGMTNTCSDTQLADFYSDWPDQVASLESSLGVQVGWITVFDSDAGVFPHSLTNRPLATRALATTLIEGAEALAGADPPSS